MGIKLVLKLIGLILILFSLNLLPVMLVELIYQQGQINYLALSFGITIFFGFIILATFS